MAQLLAYQCARGTVSPLHSISSSGARSPAISDRPRACALLYFRSLNRRAKGASRIRGWTWGDWNPIAIPAPHSPHVLLVLPSPDFCARSWDGLGGSLTFPRGGQKVWAEQWSEGDGGKTRRWEWEWSGSGTSSIDDQPRAPRHASLTPACVAGAPRFDCLGIIREVHHLASSRLDWTSRSGRNTLRQTQKPPRPEGSMGGGLHAINNIQTKVDLLKYCHRHNIKVPPSPLLSSPGTLPHLDEDGVVLLFEDIHLGRSVIPPHAVPVKPMLVKWDAARPLGCR
ncbi:hypothetical protein B0H14DRAFT_3429876 [Mycena olivaceomarginata]|nr:hypothetical protein B0H14DRAFT_3429876 [Mycena olivaceomarginata]